METIKRLATLTPLLFLFFALHAQNKTVPKPGSEKEELR